MTPTRRIALQWERTRLRIGGAQQARLRKAQELPHLLDLEIAFLRYQAEIIAARSDLISSASPAIATAVQQAAATPTSGEITEELPPTTADDPTDPTGPHALTADKAGPMEVSIEEHPEEEAAEMLPADVAVESSDEEEVGYYRPEASKGGSIFLARPYLHFEIGRAHV